MSEALDLGKALQWAQMDRFQGNAGFEVTLRNLGIHEMPRGRVLDLGAGTFGAFQYEASMLAPETEIVSLSPVYSMPDTRTIMGEYLSDIAPEATPDIAEQIANHEYIGVAGLAERLPFLNNSFDLVISHASVPTHLLKDNAGLHYKHAFLEVLRVVKLQGLVIMGPMRRDDLDLALQVLADIEDFRFSFAYEAVEKPEYTSDPSDWYRILIVKE